MTIIDRSTFINNSASNGGGVALVFGGSVTATLYINSNPTDYTSLWITNNNFFENTALNGGIMYAQDSLIDVSIENNNLI